MRGTRFGVSCSILLGGVAAALLATTAHAVDPVPVERPVREAFPEVAVGGMTAREIIARQDDLHTWLLMELPEGTVDRSVLVQLSDAELATLATPQLDEEGRLRVGFVRPLAAPITVADLSRKLLSARSARTSPPAVHKTDDGGFVWAKAIHAAGVDGVRLHFTDVSIPDDADLYVMSRFGDVHEPYQRRGPNGDGDFWTHTVMSDTAIIVVRHFGPNGADDLGRLSLTISEVGFIGRGFNAPQGGVAAFCSYNENCIENTNCSGGPAWSAKGSAENAVAMMLWSQGPWLYTCSGGLIADTDGSTQIPYFLTANHCLSKSSNNLEAHFQYQVPCNGSCPGEYTGGGTVVGGGATAMASGRSGDYTLLRLNNNPPAGSVFMGWTTANVANANGTALFRISHPATAPQAYSAQTVDTSATTCQGWPRGERIYSRDTYGATEGGSSGSPVYNAAGQIVGQLTGACGFNVNDPCDSASNATVDGALAHYFPNVAQFLDPSGTPSEICDNSLDDDGDNLVDCDDPDCDGDPACGGGGCVNPGGADPGASCPNGNSD